MTIFGRIKNWFGQGRSMQSVSNTFGRLGWFGLTAKSGVVINRDTSLTLSAVFRAMTLLSDCIASLPLNVYNIENKSVNLLIEHPVNHVLFHKPNNLYTPFVFKQTIMMQLLTDGNCYILKKYNVFRELESLRILDSREVEVFVDEDLDLKQFKYRSKTYDQSEIIHVLGISFNGLLGISPIAAARENLGLSIASQQYGNEVFRNGIFSSGVLEYPNVLTDSSYVRLKNTFAESYQGLTNSGKPIILEGGGQYKPINLKVEDRMFIESRQMTVQEVARIFGVPPHLLYDLSKSSFSNIENLGIEFVRYSLRGWVEKIESALNTDLIREKEIGRVEIRFDLDAMLRGDSASRAALYQSLFNVGAISPNEIRQKEGFNDYDGGDDKFVQLNMMPTDMIRTYYSNNNKNKE